METEVKGAFSAFYMFTVLVFRERRVATWTLRNHFTSQFQSLYDLITLRLVTISTMRGFQAPSAKGVAANARGTASGGLESVITLGTGR